MGVFRLLLLRTLLVVAAFPIAGVVLTVEFPTDQIGDGALALLPLFTLYMSIIACFALVLNRRLLPICEEWPAPLHHWYARAAVRLLVTAAAIALLIVINPPL